MFSSAPQQPSQQAIGVPAPMPTPAYTPYGARRKNRKGGKKTRKSQSGRKSTRS
jgi:hypothetical protein